MLSKFGATRTISPAGMGLSVMPRRMALSHYRISGEAGRGLNAARPVELDRLRKDWWPARGAGQGTWQVGDTRGGRRRGQVAKRR
jgi:hypothetical protein